MSATEGEGAVVHRYPGRALAGDLVRALGGAAVVGVPLFSLELNRWVAGGLGALVALFVYFGLLTVFRSRMKIRVDREAITVVAPWRQRIVWSRLDGVTLNYYSTGSGGGQGWMHLVLRSGRRRIKVDSRLPGFAAIARCALRAARANRVTPSETTLVNYRSLGVAPDVPEVADREGARW